MSAGHPWGYQEAVKRGRRLGKAAARQGLQPDANPYQRPDYRQFWMRGWHEVTFARKAKTYAN